MIVIFIVMMLVLIEWGGASDMAWVILTIISLAGALLIAVAVYGTLTREYYTNRLHVDETRCRKCGYILRGIKEPRCSECGERI